MNERRRRARLPLMSMEARVKVKKGLFSVEWIEAKVIDFSKLGLGLASQTLYDPGEVLVLTLRLASDVGDINIEEVKGVIRHRKIGEQGDWAYGIEFDLTGAKRPVLEGLERIEGVLDRLQKLNERVKADNR